MSWTFRPTFDAGHRAALHTGSSLLYVAAPAGWAVRPLLEELPPTDTEGLQTLVLTPTTAEALELVPEAGDVQALAPVHPAAGLDRTCRLLETGIVRTLLATPGTALQLLRRSALRPDALRRLLILWPEWHDALAQADALDTVLAETAGVQRLVATGDDSAVTDFLERHARRAPLLRTTLLPERPTGRVRAVVVEDTRRPSAALAILDQMNPRSALVWDPSGRASVRWAQFAWDPTVSVSAEIPQQPLEVAIAAELPSWEAYATLAEIADDVVVLCSARQVDYLRTFVRSITPYRVPSEADRAPEWLSDVRERVRQRVSAGGLEPHLFALAPLLSDYDPTLIAAALLTEPADPGDRTAASSTTVPTWAHLRLSAGKRERVRAGDVVGALLNAVGISKTQVGRVDVRDNFTIVEIRAEAADRARRGLDGVTLRGTRVRARFDER